MTAHLRWRAPLVFALCLAACTTTPPVKQGGGSAGSAPPVADLPPLPVEPALPAAQGAAPPWYPTLRDEHPSWVALGAQLVALGASDDGKALALLVEAGVEQRARFHRLLDHAAQLPANGRGPALARATALMAGWRRFVEGYYGWRTQPDLPAAPARTVDPTPPVEPLHTQLERDVAPLGAPWQDLARQVATAPSPAESQRVYRALATGERRAILSLLDQAHTNPSSRAQLVAEAAEHSRKLSEFGELVARWAR